MSQSNSLPVDLTFAHELAIATDGLFGPDRLENPTTTLTTLLAGRDVDPLFTTMLVAVSRMLRFELADDDPEAFIRHMRHSVSLAIDTIWNDHAERSLELAQELTRVAVDGNAKLDTGVDRSIAVAYLVTLLKVATGISTIYSKVHELDEPSWLLRTCLGVNDDPSVLLI